MPRLGSSVLLSLGIASAASAATMEWTPIGNPGNACSQSIGCHGAVPYSYSIGTYEVTNAQYAEFLNAKAASDPLGLYNTEMGSPGDPTYGSGITRAGVSGSYAYSVVSGREEMPVNLVSFFDALRFANWMNNGQGGGDTETGAYTLLGGTEIPSNWETVTRNAGATIVLTSENEWYKAAYYDAVSTSYFDYPAGSDTETSCAAPSATPNTANCYDGDKSSDITIKGSYTGSASPYGTFDQGGNVEEWLDDAESGLRERRGGSFTAPASYLSGSVKVSDSPWDEGADWGFRLAMIPEPGTGVLVIAGLLGLAGWRRVRT